MLAFADVAVVLGIPTRSPESLSAVGLIGRIEHGLPVKAVDRIAHLLAPGDAHFKHRLIPKATLDRRRAANRLSPDEGARLARLANVWSLARDVWGDDDEARAFLFRPHPMAEDKLPIDLAIQSEFGADLIIDILGRLKFGSAA